MAAAEKERESLANDRQQMSNDLEKLQSNMRSAASELAPTQPGAASSLRDALSGMDQADLTNLVQRTADWLRDGINPNSNGTETEIANDLKKLDDQVRQAQQAAGSGQNARNQDNGTQTAALNQVDRLRSQIESSVQKRPAPRPTGTARAKRPGNQQGRAGQQGQGQSGQQRGQSGQQGQQPGQSGQNGQGGQVGQGNQVAQGGNRQGGQNAQRGGQQNAPMGGEYVNGPLRGGGGSTDANLNVDTGGQRYGSSRNPAAPQIGPNPADTERFIQQGMNELSQLRQETKDPAAQKEINDLEKEMQKLDPSRFPGNPAMVEELHAKVLNDVDKLELQLRRDPGAPQDGQVRTATPPAVPPGYEDAVAEYYRRLSKGQ